jgi:hypothetical protein
MNNKRKQETVHTDARKRPAAVPPTNGEPMSKRAVRTNRGGGGPAKKVEAFDKATENSKRRKAGAAPQIPDSEPLNPMAPAGPAGRKSRRSKEKVCQLIFCTSRSDTTEID